MHRESVRSIKDGSAPFRLVIKIVLWNLRTRVDQVLYGEQFVAITEIAAESIVRANQQPVRQLLIEFDVSRVVFRFPRRFERHSRTPRGIDSALLHTWHDGGVL